MSRTIDKLYPVSLITFGSVAMGMEVDIFATFWDLNALRKDMMMTNTKISKEFEESGQTMM